MMLVLICTSIFLLVLSTVPENQNGWMEDAEVFFTYFFTFELFVRLLPVKNLSYLLTDPYLWCDVLAVLPSYVVMFGDGSSLHVSMRLMRALRTLRLLKMSRSYDGSIVVYRTLRLSISALGVPAYFLAVAVVVFASVIYYLELENPDTAGLAYPTKFESIPAAIWFVLTPLTTNGSMFAPDTDAGKFATGIAMVFGVLFLSMPLSIVGQNFTTIWEDRERVIFIEKVKEKYLDSRDLDRAALIRTFSKLDQDGSGTLTLKELRVALRSMGVNMTSHSMRQLWRCLDMDRSGEIEADEFVKLFFDDDHNHHRGTSRSTSFFASKAKKESIKQMNEQADSDLEKELTGNSLGASGDADAAGAGAADAAGAAGAAGVRIAFESPEANSYDDATIDATAMVRMQRAQVRMEAQLQALMASHVRLEKALCVATGIKIGEPEVSFYICKN